MGSSPTKPQDNSFSGATAAMSQDKPLPFIYQFAAGAVAGVSEILVMYPLDVVKTRIQLQSGTATGEDAYSGMMDCFRKIVRNEGVSRLYRGIEAPILMEAPKRATKFAANDAWGKFYRDSFGVAKMNQSLSVLTGATAGATEALVVVPFELVKIRLQDRTSQYKGMMDVVIKTVKTEGPLALYNGLESTMWRHILWNPVTSDVSSKSVSFYQRPRTRLLKWDLICSLVRPEELLVRSSTHPWMWSSPVSRIVRRSQAPFPSTTGHGQQSALSSRRRDSELYTKVSCQRFSDWVQVEVSYLWFSPESWISSKR